MEAPSIFLRQVLKQDFDTAKNQEVALRLAVLADVKIQRIMSGQAKRDSYIDLINYLAALTQILFESKVD